MSFLENYTDLQISIRWLLYLYINNGNIKKVRYDKAAIYHKIIALYINSKIDPNYYARIL